MYLKKIDWDVADVVRQLRSMARQASNPANDGFTARGCKQDLFTVKCLIEDLYDSCPTFSGEEEWAEQRTIDLLRKKFQ